MPVYTLDRYHGRTLMAEGAKVHANSDEEALQKARTLFWERPFQRDGFRIVGIETGDDLAKNTSQGS